MVRTGPFVAALEYATGVKAEVIGKPAESYFRACLRPLERDGVYETDWSEVGMVSLSLTALLSLSLDSSTALSTGGRRLAARFSNQFRWSTKVSRANGQVSSWRRAALREGRWM